MIGDVVFKSAALGVEKSFEAIDLLFELAAVAYSKTRLLSLLVDAFPAVARTPATSGLCAVALDFAILAKLAAANQFVRTINRGDWVE